MIYYSDPRFIFVHVPRTGGTSVEAVLCQYFLDNPLSCISKEEARKHILPAPQYGHQHYKLCEYESRLAVELDTFFSFAFVRNPWDLAASEVRYFQRVGHPVFAEKSFSESIEIIGAFRENIWGHDFRPQVEYLLDSNGQQRVDFVGRFEALQTDFHHICARLNIPRLLLPREMQTSDPLRGYRSLYNKTTREIIAKRYRADIECFQYSFMATEQSIGHLS